MITYELDFINSYYKSLENNTLDNYLQNLLNDILDIVNNDASLNIIETENDNKYKKKYKFKKYDNYKEHSILKNYKDIKKKQPIKDKFDTVKSNIKTIINKLTTTNYLKLEKEFIDVYNNYLNSCENENIKEVYLLDNFIIETIIFNNVSYSSIYNDLLFSIIKLYCVKDYKLDNIFIYNLLKEKFEDFLDFKKYILSSETDDEIIVNKNNDCYKCLCIFIINFYKKTIDSEIFKTVNNENYFIDDTKIENFILLLNDFFMQNLEKTNNKIYCENILEFIILLINYIFTNIDFLKLIDKNLNIYNSLQSILEKNVKLPSFTNKIKFKLMDIRDKYKKNNLV